MYSVKGKNYFVADSALYTFDDKQYALIGEISKSLLQLGDEVYVKVKNADLVKKQLDFNFLRRKE